MSEPQEKLTGYVVTIHNVAYIPFIKRNGPILAKTSIAKNVFENLVKLGFDVRIHSKVVTKFYPDKPQEEVVARRKKQEASTSTGKPIESPVVNQNTVVASIENSSLTQEVKDDEVVLTTKQEEASKVEEVDVIEEVVSEEIVEEIQDNTEEIEEVKEVAETEEVVLPNIPSEDEISKMTKSQIIKLLEEVDTATGGGLVELKPFDTKTTKELISSAKALFYPVSE